MWVHNCDRSAPLDTRSFSLTENAAMLETENPKTYVSGFSYLRNVSQNTTVTYLVFFTLFMQPIFYNCLLSVDPLTSDSTYNTHKYRT
jgi:hypothetical protein